MEVGLSLGRQGGLRPRPSRCAVRSCRPMKGSGRCRLRPTDCIWGLTIETNEERENRNSGSRPITQRPAYLSNLGGVSSEVAFGPRTLEPPAARDARYDHVHGSRVEPSDYGRERRQVHHRTHPSENMIWLGRISCARLARQQAISSSNGYSLPSSADESSSSSAAGTVATAKGDGLLGAGRNDGALQLMDEPGR